MNRKYVIVRKRFSLQYRACFQVSECAGFSLVELMVSLGVSALLMLAAMLLHQQQLQHYRVQLASAHLQENARLVLDMLLPAISSSGFLGCAGIRDNPPRVLNQNPLPPLAVVQGWEATGNNWLPALPAEITRVIPGTDVLQLMQAVDCGAYLFRNASSNSEALPLACPNRCSFSGGETALVTDCWSSHIFKVGSTGSCGEQQDLPHGLDGNFSELFCTAYDSAGQCLPGASVSYRRGSTVFLVQFDVWYLRTGASGAPALWHLDRSRPLGGNNPAEVLEDVDDLQVRYVLDANGDGNPDSWIDAANVNNWSQVIAVQINLSLRSSEQGLTSNTADGRLRMPLQMQLALRNHSL